MIIEQADVESSIILDILANITNLQEKASQALAS